MSNFRVQVQNLYGAMDSAESLESVLQQAASSVKSVKQNLRAQIRQRERIDSRLNSTAQQLEAQRLSVGRVVSVGRQAAGLYQDTEQKLLNVKAASAAGADDKTDKKPFALEDLFSWENLWKLVGAAGIAGQGLEAVASFIMGDKNGDEVKRWLKLVKNVTKIAGSGAKLADKGGSALWKYALGFKDQSVGKAVPTGFKANWAEEINKYKFSEANSGWGKVATGAKWAGTLLEIGGVGYSNWKEFNGNWANPQMYVETVVESGLKIGSGMVISAAVGTGAVAVLGCTPVGWAAVGVGAVTVAASVVVEWALDGLSQLITGNTCGWVENVSDGVVKLGEAIGNGVQKAGESVAKWWNNLWS